MPGPVSNLDQLLREMRPRLNSETVAFCALPPNARLASVPAIGSFREEEGTTVIVEEHVAEALGLSPLLRAAWITLTVHSDMSAVGFTAAIATRLAKHGISCNVIAAAYHDHLFVPVAAGRAALDALSELQAEAGGTSGLQTGA